MELLGIFFGILTVISILAPLVIEGVKTLLDSKNKQYNVQYLSAGLTGVFAVVACAAYLILSQTLITPSIFVYILGTVLFSIIGALCGYDKVFKALISAFKKEG